MRLLVVEKYLLDIPTTNFFTKIHVSNLVGNTILMISH